MIYKSSDGKVKEILGKYENIIYKSIDRRAKEIFEETGSNEESFNFITDKLIHSTGTFSHFWKTKFPHPSSA